MNKLQQQHERTKALNREQERSFEEAIKNMKADNSLEEVDAPRLDADIKEIELKDAHRAENVEKLIEQIKNKKESLAQNYEAQLNALSVELTHTQKLLSLEKQKIRSFLDFIEEIIKSDSNNSLLKIILEKSYCPSDILDLIVTTADDDSLTDRWLKLLPNVSKRDNITEKTLLKITNKLTNIKVSITRLSRLFTIKTYYLNTSIIELDLILEIIKNIAGNANTTRRILDELLKLISLFSETEPEDFKEFTKLVKSHPKYKTKG